MNTRRRQVGRGDLVSILDQQSVDMGAIPGCSKPIFRAQLFTFF